MDQQRKSIYDVSTAEILRKEFVAGFARGLGGFVMTLISWGVIYVLLIKLVLPQLQGTIQELNKTLKLIPGNGTTQTTKGTTIQVPDTLLKQFEQLQK